MDNSLKTVVLGSFGSAKYKYMFSLLKKYFLEGKNGIVFSSNYNVKSFFEEFFRSLPEDLILDNYKNDFRLINIYNISFENLTKCIDQLNENEIDFLVMDDSCCDVELLEKLRHINFGNLKFVFIRQVRNDYIPGEFGFDRNMDNFIVNFDKIIFIENKDSYCTVQEIEVQNRHLFLTKEMTFDTKKVSSCDLH